MRAIIIGGAKRLGAEMARYSAHRGYDTLVTYLSSKSEAEELTKTEPRLEALQVDVREPESVSGLANSLGPAPVDLLIYNVGNYNPIPMQDLDSENFLANLNENLVGPHRVVRALWSRLETAPSPLVVFLGVAGIDDLRGEAEAVDYYIGKAGLLKLCRSFAKHSPQHMRFNMISPGHLDNSIDLPRGDALLQGIPARRAGTTSEVCQALGSMIDNEYIRGANIEVSGGYRL